FTPEPLAGDMDAIPRQAAEEVLSLPTTRHNAMVFDSTDAAMDALSMGDDPDTLHEGQRAAARPTSKAPGGEAAGAAASGPEPVAKAPDEAREPALGEPDDAGDFAVSPPIGVLYRLAVSRASG